jgi:hypothetical protein
VIKTIASTAIVMDAVIALTILVFVGRRHWTSMAAVTVYASATLGALLPWVEIWYGSTFYYGEVRDKQGLPFGVNNFGPIGTFCFLTYLIWRTRIFESDWFRARIKLARIIATLAVPLLEWGLFCLVYKRWHLWQS